MTIDDVIRGLLEAKETYGNLDVMLSSDSEGNDFADVCLCFGVGVWADGEMQDLEDGEKANVLVVYPS